MKEEFNIIDRICKEYVSIALIEANALFRNDIAHQKHV